MDPFSITAGVIGITQATIASISSLRDYIESIAEAKQVVKDVSSDLQTVQLSLAALGDVNISNEQTYNLAKADLQKTGVAEAVNSCGKAAADFSKMLDRWTRHSSAGRLSLRDHLSIGVWNREKLGRFRTQVQSCRVTVQFAVQSTQLLVQLRSEQDAVMDRSVVKQQLRELESTIREHIDLTKQEQQIVLQRKAELDGADAEDESDNDELQRLQGLQEVDERGRLLEAHLVSAGVLLSQVHSGVTGQDIRDVITAEDSKAVVGMPTDVVGKINQRIQHVQTTGKSAAVVGVYGSGVNMQDMFKT